MKHSPSIIGPSKTGASKISWPDGLSDAKFLAEYWQKKPLLIRSAFPEFNNPVDPDELAGLACDEDANARYIEHTGNNEWRLCQGPLSDDFFDDVTGSEWSLLVSDVEKLLPDFREYLLPFRFIPDWRIDDLMISYAPVGGSVGAHVDQYDVFLLQADGTREWSIENTAREKQDSSASVSSTIAILGDFAADETWQLEAGDMLYLPPQFAHHGIAKDEPCMTWSIGFRAPSVDEMLPEIINYVLESKSASVRFQDPQRSTSTNPGLISNDDIAALRKMLTEALQQTDETLNQWIGRCVTEPKELQEDADDSGTITSAIVSNYLSRGNTLVSNSQKRIAYTLCDSKTTLFADGKPYSCSTTIAEAICDYRSVSGEDASEQDSLDLLTTLCQKQVLLMQTPETDKLDNE